MTRLVLGIDSSTTACKAIAWDATGHPIAEGRAAIPLHNPGPGAYEQDASQFWSSLIEAVHQVTHVLGPNTAHIEALCIAHQRETFVLADDHGIPLAPALVWMDARCTEDVDRASQEIGIDKLHTITGKVPCTTPSFYKLLGLLRRRPELRSLRPWFLDVHGFLMKHLVGEYVTSIASADPLGVLSMDTREYCIELLDYAGIAPDRVARLIEPGAHAGVLTSEAARALGLREGLPVIAGAGDGQAAGLGAGVSGTRAYLNLGTALVCGRLSEQYAVDRGYRTLFGASPQTYFLEGDLKAGTFLVNWLVDTLLTEPETTRRQRILQLEMQAANLVPGAEGLLLLPYWNGVMNPYWDDHATGALLGLRGDHGPAHFFRATLEGLALEVRLHLESLNRTGKIQTLVMMGGGAQSNLFCQIIADTIGHAVVRSESAEATSLGAAILAATATGIHPSLENAVAAMACDTDPFEPGLHREFYDSLYREVYRPLYPTLATSLQALAHLRKIAPRQEKKAG